MWHFRSVQNTKVQKVAGSIYTKVCKWTLQFGEGNHQYQSHAPPGEI